LDEPNVTAQRLRSKKFWRRHCDAKTYNFCGAFYKKRLPEGKEGIGDRREETSEWEEK
jgi:hypothetical protein